MLERTSCVSKFWVVEPCQYFGYPYCLHLEGQVTVQWPLLVPVLQVTMVPVSTHSTSRNGPC
jgi:hypothetical protein